MCSEEDATLRAIEPISGHAENIFSDCKVDVRTVHLLAGVQELESATQLGKVTRLPGRRILHYTARMIVRELVGGDFIARLLGKQ